MFVSVKIQNFLSYIEAELPLANRGLCLIAGEMLGFPSASSNGSGKSTLLPESILFALFGRTLRGITGTDVVHRNAGQNCLVSLTLHPQNGNPLVIHRPVKHKKHAKPWVQMGAEQYVGAAEVAKVVDLLLGGVSFSTFTSAVIFSRTGFFTQLTDAQRKECLEELAGLSVLSQCSTVVRERIKVQTQEIVRATQELALREQSWGEQTKAYETMRARADEFKVTREQQLEECHTKLTGYRARLAQLEVVLPAAKQTVLAFAAGADAALAKLTEVRGQVQTDEHAITALKVRMAGHTAAAHTHRARMAEVELLIERGQCPTCEQDVERATVESRLLGYADQVEAEERQAAEVSGTLLTLVVQHKKEQEEQLKWENALHAAREGRSTADLALGRLQSEGTLITAQKQVTEKEIATLSAAAEDSEKDIAAAKLVMAQKKEAVVQAKRTVETAEHDAAYLEFWNAGFGPVGLKAQLLATMMPALNAQAGHYSNVLTDSTVSVEFTGETTLKSGETRSKFDVVCGVEDAGAIYAGLSDGQRRRADLIATLALADQAASRLTVPTNLLILDELLDGLDSAGIERAGVLLQELARKRSSVFCITHTDGFAHWFPHRILVEHVAGVSRISDVT